MNQGETQPSMVTLDSSERQSRERASLAARIKSLRQERGWSLATAGERMGVARSTLSKIENGIMSPTFDLLQRICFGFHIDITELFIRKAHGDTMGRRTISRYREGPTIDSDRYVHELLAHDLTNKKLLPFRTTVNAKSIRDFGRMVRHEGEVILTVVKGEVSFHSEYYTPVTLAEGDSVYFDSKMAHALTSNSETAAEVVWVCENRAVTDEG